jgi:putative Holliday junction resolvase
MTNFWLNLDGGRRAEPEQANAIATAAITKSFTGLRMGCGIMPYLRPWRSGPRRHRLAGAVCPLRGTLAGVRALGIDYGERRIGLALSDATGLLASPWKTIANDGNVGAAAQRLAIEVNALIAESDGLSVIVIGLPRRLSGDPNEQTARVQQLVRQLGDTVSLPIELQDERLTSYAAEEILAEHERDWRKRKQQLDAMAAALILQDYLDHRTRA